MTVRLDKWLWAARFFKTRSLACDAIKGGKVSVNGLRTKPGHSLLVGDKLSVRKGHELKTLIVHELSIQRGPATVAQQLYEETMESLQCREKEKQLRQLSAAQRPRGEGRPTKRARRLIHRFTDPD
ncbi:MAG: RNA-binding protein [Gammaproteobacteria bacterium]|nr:RNA-binding protein [Gammaproteobacteria bacterium]